MDHEPEVTHTQMDETRASLSEKLETLEHQVVDTVQGATHAVADTVENVKDAVQDTLDTVKHTFDLRRQVRRHPWTVVGGSIALGYLGGYLLFRSGLARRNAKGESPPAPPDRPRRTEQPNGVIQQRRAVAAEAVKQPIREVASAPAGPGWLSWVHNLFGPEITKLKSLAVGTGLSVVRDLILESVPEQRKTQLSEIMDRITVKLGGEPVRGPVIKAASQSWGSATEEERAERGSSARSGPVGASQRHAQTTVRKVD